MRLTEQRGEIILETVRLDSSAVNAVAGCHVPRFKEYANLLLRMWSAEKHLQLG